MRAGINIPELSLYRIFFCPAHTNFLCPVYPGLTVGTYRLAVMPGAGNVSADEGIERPGVFTFG